MSERFVWIEGDAIDFPYFIDSVKRLPNGLYSSYHYDNRSDFEDIFDVLNELHNENEQLKQQVAFLEEFIKTGVQYEYYQKIYDENKQLKQQLKELQEFKDNYDKNMELIHNSEYVQDFLNGNL